MISLIQQQDSMNESGNLFSLTKHFPVSIIRCAAKVFVTIQGPPAIALGMKNSSKELTSNLFQTRISKTVTFKMLARLIEMKLWAVQDVLSRIGVEYPWKFGATKRA